MSGLVQSAFVVQSCAALAGHFVSHFEVYVVRPVASSQQTPPAQLCEPEQVSVSPPRQVASAATHVCVPTQQTSVLESQVVVPHTVWSGPPSVTGGGVWRPGPPSAMGSVPPPSSPGWTMPPSGPTVGKPLSSPGEPGEPSSPAEPSSPPEPELPLVLAVPPPLPLPPLELVVVTGDPPSPTVSEPVEPPQPIAMTIDTLDTPRAVRKADMKDLLVRDSPAIQRAQWGRRAGRVTT